MIFERWREKVTFELEFNSKLIKLFFYLEIVFLEEPKLPYATNENFSLFVSRIRMENISEEIHKIAKNDRRIFLFLI